jgi:hypothetical protein
VVAACVALVGLATGFRVWALHGAWFFYDDFWYIQNARSHGLSLGYLFTAYNSHLMPAGMLVNWLNAAAEPLGFGWPATEIIVGFAVAGLGVAKLLVRLLGPRWGVLAPLTLFLFSPILLPATTWWAAAINQVPQLIAMAFSLDAFVGWLQHRRRRLLVLHLAWLVFGLAFSERTLVTFLLAWILALSWFTTGTGPERLRTLWAERRAALLAHAAMVVAYLALYVPLALDFNATEVTRRPFFEIVKDMAFTAFSAGFVGGPVRWQTTEVTQQEAAPSPLFLLASQAVLVALVVVSARTRRRALRAWLLPAAVLGFNAALVAVSRAIYFGPEIALDYRFQTEVTLAAAVAVGTAFLPVRDAVEASEPRPASWRLDTAAWAVPAVAVFLVLATVSTSRFPLRDLGPTSPRRYLQTVAAQARSHPGVVLLDATTPPWFWAPLAYPTNTYGYMFRELPGVEVARTATDHGHVVDWTGRYRPLMFVPVRRLSTPLPQQRCPVRLDDRTRQWRLDGPVFGGGWFVRIEYDATTAARGRISTAGHPADVPFRQGSHTVLVPVWGSFRDVTLRVPATAGRVCLTGLQLGAVRGSPRSP